MIAQNRLGKEEVREAYKRKFSRRLRGARTRVGEGLSQMMCTMLFKVHTEMEVAAEMAGLRESQCMVDRWN